mgnify:FL=1
MKWSKTVRIVFIIIFVLSIFSIRGIAAPVTYTYTSNNFTQFSNHTPPHGEYTENDRLEIQFTTDGFLPLGGYHFVKFLIRDFTFFDGRESFTWAKATMREMYITINPDNGLPHQWYMKVDKETSGFDCFILSVNNSMAVYDMAQISSSGFLDKALVRNSPGTWTRSTVPSPKSIVLLGSGLLGLIGLNKKKGIASSNSAHDSDRN